MERSETDWMKIAGKQRFRGTKSISIRLSEIPTNDLHKYLYPSFIISYSKTPLSLYICLTEIYKVTIACFIPTISVGFDPYSHQNTKLWSHYQGLFEPGHHNFVHQDTWKWFLTLLQDDLGLVTQHGWNFISDQQKGLELAIKEVMPNAHHRNCVLHFWKNFIKHFKDQQTKQMVDNITNNMCEVWNAKIVEYRGKPILTMCEDLRCYLMRKMATHKKKLESHSGHLAPVQQKKMDKFVKPKANKWRAIWAGDNDRVHFEVHRGTSKVGVNLQQRTCTCNVWELTGMPCCHAIAAMYKIVNLEEYWTPCDAPRTEPPNIKRPAHRPKMKRKVDPVKPEMHATKAKKTFEVTCNNCGQLGHYYKTCKNDLKYPN
ncbi:hypothetical protein AHAS_Ahas11G0160500 [Arachis hypogaea]